MTRANKSIGDFPPIFEAVGLLSSTDPGGSEEKYRGAQGADAGRQGAAQELYEAIAYKSYEFNCHGVEMNQRYASGRGLRWHADAGMAARP